MTEGQSFENPIFDIQKLKDVIFKNNIIQNICKIEYQIIENNNYNNILPVYASGFLCKINYFNNTRLPVLITCNHVLNDSFFQKYESLDLSYYIGDVMKIKILENVKNNRIIYLDKELDITIIEIKDYDKLDTSSFLEIDNSINEENSSIVNKKVYICHYPEGSNNVHISKGTILNMFEQNSFISDYLSKPGSSGSPIFNYDNNRVIGIHKGGRHEKEKNFGQGILIKQVIKKFLKQKIKENNININSYKDLYSSIDIIYTCLIDETIQLFGEEFVNKNKDKCQIKYGKNGNIIDIKQYIQYKQLSSEDRKKGEFTIQLIGINKVTNMKHMFRKCKNLKKLPNISKIDTTHVINMEAMFEECNNLEFPDLSSWKVENVKSMKRLFYNCENLKFLPGLEKWNPIKLNDCKEMFYGCKSLKLNEIDKLKNWPVSRNILKKLQNEYKFGKESNKIKHSLLEDTEEPYDKCAILSLLISILTIFLLYLKRILNQH